jgi:hypothetical protein
MNLHHVVNESNFSGDEDICLADSVLKHTILRQKQYFSYIRMIKAKVNKISSSINLIEGFGRANISFIRE